VRQFVFVLLLAGFAAGQSYIGRVDTIGGTTYDWWTNSGVRRSLVNSSPFGIHATWMMSFSSSGTTFPDRNIRYNFYDFTTRQWNWLDPDHMQSGVNVFTERAGYGAIDADSTGVVSIVAHTGTGVVLARDAAPGTGVLDYCAGPAGFSWPDMAIGDDGTHHVLMSSAQYSQGYSRVRTWCNWDSVSTLLAGSYPVYVIAASKASPLVCAALVGEGRMFYLLSENRGDTWGSAIELEPPPAFGGDTVTAFSGYGLFALIDRQDRLHFVAGVNPVVHDTAYSNPVEIWHWCGQNNPAWTRIHRAGCAPEHLQAGVGYNAAYADRPSIGESSDGRLYVAWEQFDSSNVEPLTDRLRAGVWASGSQDNGASWTPGVLVTGRNTFSHRFPCVVNRMVTGEPDTICVLYLMDSVAGFFVQDEGPGTPNPVVCQFIPSPMIGIEERMKDEGGRMNNGPTILSGPSVHSLASKVVFDASGRRVVSPKSGVYFVAEYGARSTVHVRKVVIQR